jgi:hypothetical protein
MVVSVLVVLCGAAIIAGTRLGWVTASGRRPASGVTDTSVAGLLHWSYRPCSTYFALVVLASLLASRFGAVLFSLVALAGAGLWIGLNASHFNPISLTSSDLRIGAWLTIGGALAGFIAAFFLRRRVV